MPFLTAGEFPPTGDAVVDVLADGVIWDLPEERTITWALADGFAGDSWNDRAAAIGTFSDALAAIQQYIDVQFAYLGDFSSPIAAGEAGADLVYTLDNTVTDDGTLAYAYFPGPGVFAPNVYATEGGDVFLNFSNPINATSSFGPGSDGFVTIIHEIGHALGLKHPFEESPGRPSIAATGREDIADVDWMTVMSYTDPFEDELERWDPATPMVLDVLALQFLYGANTRTHAGDTVHRLQNQDYYVTIWDASGTDVIDISAMTEGWTVTLPNAPLSTEIATRVGLATMTAEHRDVLTEMAPTELFWMLGDIEDVIGTGHDDRISGTAIGNVLSGGGGDDVLTGLGGNDTLVGGAGDDSSVHSGAQSRYTLTLRPDAMTIEDRAAGGDGTDTLDGIELLRFGGEANSANFDLRKFGGPASLDPADLQSFIELYIAYFNRAPDAVGLNFWGTAFASGTTLEQMAALFGPQAETQAAYPIGTSNEVFATSVYTNVLGRTPDQDGIDFWVAQLESGTVTRDQFILQVLRGARSELKPEFGDAFVAQQVADRAYLENKIDIGAYFAVHKGMSDVANAVSAMSLYDGSAESIAAAVAAIDDFYDTASDAETGEFLMPIVGVLETPFMDLV